MKDQTDIIEILKNPPELAKGWTRWWWYGCAVTKEEISRELHLMKDAGLGGVEIAILYPLEADDKEKGIYNIPFYSPEFFEILEYTLTEAESLGLGVDFTLGSSWPYGGPFVPQSMAPQTVTSWQIDVTGPVEDFYYDFTTVVEGDIIGVSMGQMENSQMKAESLTDITDHLRDKKLYGWPWGKELADVQIPEGNWKITAFVSHGYRQTVPIPTRGAGGYAIDHCRKDVTDFFMKNAAQPLLDRLGEHRIRCFFCDSLELEGNNWTEILPAEFKKRRGYDLMPYIYGLVGTVDDLTPRIRYDYYLTMSELTLENFFDRMTKWCEEHEMQSRIQAHGTWADILKAYALADIPEGESFGLQAKLHVNTIHRRLASSAAHIYGREIVSNESFTWLRVPRFLVTLENVKAAADAIFLDGMNAIINHGYAYSPERVGTPGHPFYASSNLNHTNPAWDCYPEVAKYIQRMSAVLRQGYVRNDVAVYLPQADVWSETPMANLHMGMRLQEYIQWGVPDRIVREGFSFDYINDEALTDLAVMEDGMKIRENCYKMILLIGCKRIPAETAKVLEKFVQNGGKLLAAETVPVESCGLKDWQKEDAQVKEIMQRLFSEETDTWKSYGNGSTARSTDRTDGMLRLMRKIQKPDVEIMPKSVPAGYLHRKVGEEDIYFLANISDTEQKLSVDFADQDTQFRVFDCVTASPKGVISAEKTKDGVHVELDVEAFGSVLFVFGKGRTYETTKEENPMLLTEVKNWVFTVSERNFRKELEQPVYWQTFEELRDYSGMGIYEAEFEILEMPDGKVYLELEALENVARVEINGKSGDVMWKRPWRIDISETLRLGKNQIKLSCTGSLINSILDQDKDPKAYEGTLMDGWPYFTEVLNQSRKRRIGMEKERAAIKEPIDIGLQGAVRIVVC